MHVQKGITARRFWQYFYGDQGTPCPGGPDPSPKAAIRFLGQPDFSRPNPETCGMIFLGRMPANLIAGGAHGPIALRLRQRQGL